MRAGLTPRPPLHHEPVREIQQRDGYQQVDHGPALCSDEREQHVQLPLRRRAASSQNVAHAIAPVRSHSA